jgi:hypothetical protein
MAAAKRTSRTRKPAARTTAVKPGKRRASRGSGAGAASKVIGSRREWEQRRLASGARCGEVAAQTLSSTGQQRLLAGSSCCSDSVEMLLAGLDKMTKDEPAVAGHMKAFVQKARDQFLAGDLLEYCVIVFGLKDQERDDLLTHVEKTYAR